jgi:NADH:ubiquinone oxidoreductase subunit F (NADH-binding)/(2Fe-2S) ferredoxin
MNGPQNVMTMPLVDLQSMADSYAEDLQRVTRRVIVCAGTGCVANGSLEVHDALAQRIAEAGLPVVTQLEAELSGSHDWNHVSQSGCQGFCQMGPLVAIEPDGILYTCVHLGDVEDIVERTLQQGELVERLLYRDPASQRVCRGQADIPFYAQQQRRVLKQCGRVDPGDLREYVHAGGYQAAQRAYREMTPEEVCAEVARSGLRGRGGGGFPTGRKWQLTLAQPGPKKYVICNADEGDPGAFMNRRLLEGDPHAVLEGMIIAGYAIGAHQGYIYCRAEYPIAVRTIRIAIRQARELGFLGKDIMGTGFDFDVELRMGAGAFVCGEETALMASIEGRRGEPRPRPPFPAVSGLWGKPTIINNVETLANIPNIIRRGADWFQTIGNEKNKGTKTFTLAGDVVRTGLIEVPLGITLGEVVFDVAGGIKDGRKFKAIQTGGPMGGCIPEQFLETPIDYENLGALGSIMGSGGLVVMDDTTCMVDIARFFMEFTQDESCGKCVPCRIGTRRILEILEKICKGDGEEGDIERLENLSKFIVAGSLCGLGQGAPNPVLTTIKYFRDEYEAHIREKKCTAKVCKGLITYRILENCTGCMVCGRNCPSHAITGEKKKLHVIADDLCERCGICLTVCKFDAIVVE